MDLNVNGQLVALERLLEEFFNPLTNNIRKHEIEQQLESFRSAPEIWKLCLYFVTNTSSQYVTMFALSTLENIIKKQWMEISQPDKEYIRTVIFSYLIEHVLSMPHFLKGKYAKLLADIAKHEWPHNDPNYFINILELLKSEANQLVGLILLRTTSEEFMCIPCPFSSDRKDEITRLLQPYIPVVFELLRNILDNLGTKPRHTSTATPPPSPTHPSSHATRSPNLAPTTSRPDTRALIKEALETLQQLLTWTPVDKIPPEIVQSVFAFTNRASYAQEDDDMCVLAMSAVCEVLYRKSVPPGSRQFFERLFQHTVVMLRDIIHCGNRVDSLDPLFVEKLSELLVLLIDQHMWRFEQDHNFSALDFLSYLYNLTMQLPSVPCYMHCATVWAAFLKQIKPENSHKYAEVFKQLVYSLLKKVQFTYNYDQLITINNSDVNDDNETDWQIFVKATIEIIVMIAEHSPSDTIQVALLPWNMANDFYKHLETAVDHNNCALNYEINQTDNMYYLLKDYSTTTQTIARLASVVADCPEVFKCAAQSLNVFVDKLLESAVLATSVRFYNLKMGDSRLTEAFVDIHAQLLAALKTILIWMSHESKLTNHNLKTLLDITIPVLQESTTVPSKVTHSAAHLLWTITNVVPFTELMLFPVVPQFVLHTPGLKFAEKETMFVVYNAVSALLMKPWKEMTEEVVAKRHTLIATFFEILTREFVSLNAGTPQNRVKEVTDRLFPVMSHIIDNLKDYPTSTKKLLNGVVLSTFSHALTVCRNCIYTNEHGTYEQFFLSIFGVLQPECLKDNLEAFLREGFDRHTANLTGVESVLQMLQEVVETRSTVYKSLLPTILHFCMDITYPAVCSRASENPEVYQTLIVLLHSILLYRWQYFYMSQVRLGYSPGCSEDAGPDTPRKPEHLLAVLNVFGHALEQNDINVFRSSLWSLEDINTKWKLYQKLIFKQAMSYNFLNVLIKTLIDKTKDLLAEEILVAIYNIASVDLNHFFKFLEQFVHSIEGVNGQQGQVLLQNFVFNHDKDMPTFVHQLQRFVNDVQHYRLCNRTLSV